MGRQGPERVINPDRGGQFRARSEELQAVVFLIRSSPSFLSRGNSSFFSRNSPPIRRRRNDSGRGALWPDKNPCGFPPPARRCAASSKKFGEQWGSEVVLLSTRHPGASPGRAAPASGSPSSKGRTASNPPRETAGAPREGARSPLWIVSSSGMERGNGY